MNAFLLQPFINYNLPDGWYLTSSPVLTANWKADKAGKELRELMLRFSFFRPIGRLDKPLDDANAKGWTVTDMKKDWKRVFPFDK